MNSKLTQIQENTDLVKSENMENLKEEKYLTEMKELPPSYTVEKKKKSTENKQEKEKEEPLVSESSREVSLIQKTDKPEINMSENHSKNQEKEKVTIESEVGKRKLPVTYKDFILGVVNLISFVFFVIILVNFPQKSKELKELRINEIKKELIVGLETSDIEKAKPKVEVINKFFLDESGVVSFVNDVELQEIEDGANIKVTFASQKAVADRTGNFGIPVVIEIRGSWEAIDVSLQKIEKLPYLVRPANVNISTDEEDPNIIVYKYGLVLYVNESLGKTR